MDIYQSTPTTDRVPVINLLGALAQKLTDETCAMMEGDILVTLGYRRIIWLGEDSDRVSEPL